jgi:hypothetical protein
MQTGRRSSAPLRFKSQEDSDDEADRGSEEASEQPEAAPAPAVASTSTDGAMRDDPLAAAGRAAAGRALEFVRARPQLLAMAGGAVALTSLVVSLLRRKPRQPARQGRQQGSGHANGPAGGAAAGSKGGAGKGPKTAPEAPGAGADGAVLHGVPVPGRLGKTRIARPRRPPAGWPAR